MPKQKRRNSKKDAFLSSLPEISLNSEENDLAKRCKFNFSYFVNDDEAGQNFTDWTHADLIKLFEKLKEYSKAPLENWTREKVGRYSVLVIYGPFPENSHFKEPKHIPIEAQWCRIHLENKPRLIGFIIPDKFNGVEQGRGGYKLDSNVFYVVFLDKDHKFYPTKKS
ncbi:MAG: hypothetical protein LGB55_07200 [Sulfurovum sp.]|nr:hypothetical protein [Sulfurovum sp.]